MLSTEIILKIRELRKESHSYATIGHILHVSYPTIVKYLKETDPTSIKTGTNVKSLELISPYEEKISKYIRSGINSSKKVEQLLKLDGYKGTYQLLNKYIKNKQEEVLLGNIKSYFRVETEPGEQAQVDWGHFGKIEIRGMPVNLYVFVMVLSYSRAIYAEFVTSQKQKILQHCHINAFRYLGGVPQKIRYDNMKTVVIDRKNKENPNWNFEFKNFARYYKFELELSPIYYPQSKGKVEAAVKFIRNNFFKGESFNKTFHTVNDLNEKLLTWLNEHANKRNHPVQLGSVGALWLNEQKLLRPMEDTSNFWNIASQIRRVSRISMVNYKKASYWVPKKYVQHKVEIREVLKNGQTILEFYSKEGKIYEHSMGLPGSWNVPNDRDLVKNKSKEKSIFERVKNHPIYKTKVEVRDLSYYEKLINHM